MFRDALFLTGGFLLGGIVVAAVVVRWPWLMFLRHDESRMPIDRSER